ncbi:MULTISPECIES: glycosyltransferase family 4 protein [unclassified Janthinobacterium]|uniref:glycosyltransferase family 4 protein n=1 Tax=unclassified Janthinobacterium TaxID=2610881 RepID=UPI00034A503F|nr:MULTISPECIES: glycosyltransferase family 4 protein [unclassified Janthinobacterium]MEC5159792.1 glycosyltransferase involved in cell wall biosynthesis [Janthinobacterium sp. CG_S6]
MKVVCWHPVLTDHQSYTLEALRDAGQCELAVFVAKQEHAERQAQGWVNRHASALAPTLIPQRGWLRYIVRQLRARGEAVHLFGSPFEQPRLILALFLALAMGLRVFLISEPYSTTAAGYQDDRRRGLNWLKAQLRPALYRLYGMLMARRLGGLFAISTLAVEQYRRIGIPNEKIFRFGYFVPATGLPAPAAARPPGLRLVFVGTLIERKGLDVLIAAVKQLRDEGVGVTLDAYGPGQPEPFGFDQAALAYRGQIPFGCAQAVIGGYDALVLPSRYDGWGVVVNEALLAGVPVICSDRVGAAAVLRRWPCGAVFASESVAQLADCLRACADSPERLAAMRTAAAAAGAALEPRVAGRYMYQVLSLAPGAAAPTKPSSPWYEHDN